MDSDKIDRRQKTPTPELLTSPKTFHLQVDKNLQIIMANNSFFNTVRDFSNISDPSELNDKNFLEYIPETDRDQFVQILADIQSTKTQNNFDHTSPITSERFWGWTIIPALNELNQISGYNIQGTDITEKKAQEKKLKEQATFDALTGLRTRTALENALLDHPDLSTSDYGIIFGDVDGLKKINDTLGHSTGDLHLIALADILKTTFREEDTPIRWGGDEMVIILVAKGLTKSTLSARLEQLRNNIEKYNQNLETYPPVNEEVTNRIKIEISFGQNIIRGSTLYSTTPSENPSQQELDEINKKRIYNKDKFIKEIVDADAGMYQEKKAKKGNLRTIRVPKKQYHQPRKFGKKPPEMVNYSI